MAFQTYAVLSIIFAAGSALSRMFLAGCVFNFLDLSKLMFFKFSFVAEVKCSISYFVCRHELWNLRTPVIVHHTNTSQQLKQILLLVISSLRLSNPSCANLSKCQLSVAMLLPFLIILNLHKWNEYWQDSLEDGFSIVITTASNNAGLLCLSSSQTFVTLLQTLH